jgi:hypothetical protein
MAMRAARRIEMKEQNVNRTIIFRYYEEIIDNGAIDLAEDILKKQHLDEECRIALTRD